ncbi:MAG: WXG100 family type VII secretion target [Oscillospiraceae bacterium]|nr:WXG100 family type VII secretion target [Oscillospiraceae bacterium]
MDVTYIDTEAYGQLALKLRGLSEDLGAARSAAASAAGFVGDTWQGDASDAFLESNAWTAKGIDRLRTEMEDLAADIAAAAVAYE